ncbi:MAG: SAM-dependent methyltransferase [Pseudoalteromonas tetraodonis]|jgi:SAM-dependent methyltransferase
MQSLIDLNNFNRGGNGVYSADSDAALREFNYSDGAATEVQLYEILSASEDLSSSSKELQSQIVDWPTEYHLSETRANLLRPLNLDGVTRVLELGCGCGSISRYLGEQPGISVDAIEGSPIRAALAKLRCADLENVIVSSANFNDIEFPQDYYDLVLFVGVTEYAGRFSARATDQEALQDLLSLGQKAAKKNGITLIAIENRTGLKYLLGANEDHYAVPYIGLDDYPESTGIRTYTKSEWQLQIGKAGFAAHQFMYPFPDYKVPTLMVREGALSQLNDEHLSSIKSRDYNSAFDIGDQEHRVWQGLNISKTISELSNSFLILLGQDQAQINAMCEFGIEQYPSAQLSYRLPSEAVKVNHEVPSTDVNEAGIEFLKAELTQLQAHSKSLQETIDIMAGSSGWTWLNRIRRLLGKKSVR